MRSNKDLEYRPQVFSRGPKRDHYDSQVRAEYLLVRERVPWDIQAGDATPYVLNLPNQIEEPNWKSSRVGNTLRLEVDLFQLLAASTL